MPIEAYFCQHVRQEVRKDAPCNRIGFFSAKSGFELFSMPIAEEGLLVTTSAYLPDPAGFCSEPGCGKEFGWRVTEEEADDEDDTAGG